MTTADDLTGIFDPGQLIGYRMAAAMGRPAGS